MRTFWSSLAWLGLLAIFATSCRLRQLQYLEETPVGIRLGASATPSASATPGPTTTPERRATLQEITGQVETRPSAQADWADAFEGQALDQSSQIRTGDDGKALLVLTEGTKIRLGADTAFSFLELNPFPENRLTILKLDEGRVWVLMKGGNIDVETPVGRISGLEAFLSVDYDKESQSVDVTCLQGTCGFGDQTVIPSSYKLDGAERNTTPEPMSLADYGVWAANVDEATQLAQLVPTETPIPSSPTPPTTATPTTPPEQPTPTLAPPTPTPFPSPTRRIVLPTATRPSFTLIGQHVVRSGETIFCIGRGYGVLPEAIAQANGLPLNSTVVPNQVLDIPAVRWVKIAAGPVCAPQVDSPFPGLPISTPAPAPEPTVTPAASPLEVTLDYGCVFNCGSQEGEYILRFHVNVSGGVPPYSFNPGQNFDLTFLHCVDSSGTVTVTSADGQTVAESWFYHDVSCPPTAAP